MNKEQIKQAAEPGKWISVNDKLPEITNQKLGYSDYVLAYSDSFDWGKWFISRYDHQDEMWQYDSGHDQTHNPISHWMPLPAAPGEATVPSAGKEVKTAKRVLQEFWEADDVSQFDDDMYNSKIVVHIMELYADQFKASHGLKIADVSDQEIEKQDLILHFKKFPLLYEYIQHAATFWETDNVESWRGLLEQISIVCGQVLELNMYMQISDQEIESAGYANCGDKTNHRFTSADQIEPWIDGAKWYREQLKGKS